MIYIDKYAYFNGMKDVHPVEKFAFAILTLINVLLSASLLLSIIVICIFTLIIIFKARIPFPFYIKLILIPIYFMAAGTLTVAIDLVPPGENALFSFLLFHTKIGMTQAGCLKALKLFFKAWASVSCLYFLVLTVPVISLIHILGKMKIPALFLELMVIIYRFIFIFFDTFSRIHTAQTSRLGYKNIRTSFHTAGKLIASLFTISLKRADDMFHALESRCYNGEFGFLHKEYRSSKRNMVAILTIQSFFLILNVLS